MKMIFDDEEMETKVKEYMEDWDFEYEKDVKRIYDFNEFFKYFDLEECFHLKDFDEDVVIELSESQKNDIYRIYVVKATKALEEETKIDKFIEDCAKAMLTYANKYELKNSDGEDYTIDVFKENVSNFVYSRYDY